MYLTIILLTVGAIGVVYGYMSMGRGVEMFKQNRAISSRDLVDLDDPPEGAAAVEGVAVADECLPIGDGQCVAARVNLWQGGTGDDNTHLVNEWHDGQTGVTFSVEGDGGTVLVDGKAASVEPSEARTFERKIFSDDDVPERARRIDKWAEVEHHPSGGYRDYELEWIEEGDQVYVYGDLQYEDGKPVLTDGSGPLFVTDRDPEELAENRTLHVGVELAKGVGLIGFGLVALVIGVLVLLN